MELFYPILYGAAVGFIMSFFGSGGSILSVPILVYLLHIEPKTAIPMSLVIVGAIAFLGAIQHARHRNMVIKTAVIFTGFGIVTAILGTKVSIYLTGRQQLLIFGVVMLLAATKMFQRSWQKSEKESMQKDVHPYVAGFLGSGVGFLTGLIGVGGGFLIVPVLHFAGMPIHRAMGTSLVVIFFNCLAAFIGYSSNTTFQWPVILAFILGSSIVTIFGTRLNKKVSVKKMQQSFAIFILVIAVFILIKNF